MSSEIAPSIHSSYAENAFRSVPCLRDLHKMACVLLAERAASEARILVLGAGGGLELKAFAEMQPGWQLDGVDPSEEMLQTARSTLGAHASRVSLLKGYIDDAHTGPFDGASCLLTLHFLQRAERLETLKKLHARLKPGAPLVVAHHSFPTEGLDPDKWLKRNAAYGIASGIPLARAHASVSAIRERLPVLTPHQDVDLLREAGFETIELFYRAFTFTGWVAYKP